MKLVHFAGCCLVSFGVASAAHAQSVTMFAPGAQPAAAPPARGAGTWSLGLRVPMYFIGTPRGTGWGAFGLGVDLGKRLTDRWYLGASVDDEMEVNMGGDPAFNNLSRERLGVETRYRFHDGTALVCDDDDDNCGSVPRHDWLGMRAGVERMNGETLGAFGEATLGMDAGGGSTALGMYFTLGLSIEPASFFTDPPDETACDPIVPAPLTGTAWMPYVGFGWRFGIG
ncbi:MAG TPA: hypothetical protein VMJ10_32430 [Kofleriaceae bacterium]|nr:hypothetical protein [Kofleriaceae bacterium]